MFGDNKSNNNPEIIKKENIGFYQTNTCEFSFSEVLFKNFNNNNIKILPDLNSKLGCHGKVNGVDYHPEKIRVYIGTNINLDFLIQSLTWLLFVWFIPKTKEKEIKHSSYIYSSFLFIIFYLHLKGENSFYTLLTEKYNVALEASNYFLLIFLIGFIFVFLIFHDLLKYRFYNILNYFPFIFLFFGTFNSLNLNFFLFAFSYIGLIAISEKKINYKFLLIYFLLSAFYIFNSRNLNSFFDVDKLKGFINSSETNISLIFWLVIIYLFTTGIFYTINESIKLLDINRLKINFLISGGLMVLFGIISALNPFLNYLTYYYFGLNKLGMNTLESIQGNTWRGIGASAEAFGEYYALVILFSIFTYYFYNIKITKIELLMIFINLYGLYKTNNFAAFSSLLFILLLFWGNNKLGNRKTKFFSSVILLLIIGFGYNLMTDYNYKFASKSLIYEGMVSSNVDLNLKGNQWGRTAVEDSNFGEILLLEDPEISSSLLLITKHYTEGNNIKYLPNSVATLSALSVPINRSEKWGIFFAKYNPNTVEFIFGYGPQQLSRYYLEYNTKINDGLVLPHSSLLDLLIFFGFIGLMSLFLFISIKVYKNKDDYFYLFLLLFLILNLLKSDSILYIPSYFLAIFCLNFYKYKIYHTNKNE